MKNNYDALAASGTRAVLQNAPHNQVAGYCHRRRVDTLAQFVDLVLK